MATTLFPDPTQPDRARAVPGTANALKPTSLYPTAPAPAAKAMRIDPTGSVTPAAAMSPASPVQRFSPEKVNNIDDRLGAAGGRRIGGRGAKPGATYRRGEFKGMTEGQAFAKMAGEGPGTPAPNATGGRSAPYSATNGTMGTGKWALDANAARNQSSLASDLGLVPPGAKVPPSAGMAPRPTDPVADFRARLGALAAPQAPTAAPTATAATPPPATKVAALKPPQKRPAA